MLVIETVNFVSNYGKSCGNATVSYSHNQVKGGLSRSLLPPDMKTETVIPSQRLIATLILLLVAVLLQSWPSKDIFTMNGMEWNAVTGSLDLSCATPVQYYYYYQYL